MENKEVKFAKTLEELKRKAREQGNRLDEGEIEEAFADLELDDSRIKMVRDYMEAQKIRIGGEDQGADEEEYTPEDINFLQMYLDELESLPEHSDGEKKAYTIQAMAGERSAGDKRVEIYLKDVVNIAKIYVGQGVLIEDLIGEGNLALAGVVTMLDSQESPDECEGMIIRYIMDAMEELIKENNDVTSAGDKALKKVNDIFEKAEKLSHEYARKITVEELCEEEHLSRKSVIDAMRISGYAIDCIETPDELKGKEN